MGLSRDTDSDLNHVTGVEGNSSYDTVKQHHATGFMTDAAIARAVIGSLDERGYLTAKVDDLHELLANQINEAPEIEAMVHLVQTLSIPGIGAYGRLPSPATGTTEHTRPNGCIAISQGTPATAKHKFTELIRLLQIDREKLSQVID